MHDSLVHRQMKSSIIEWLIAHYFQHNSPGWFVKPSWYVCLEHDLSNLLVFFFYFILFCGLQSIRESEHLFLMYWQ